MFSYALFGPFDPDPDRAPPPQATRRRACRPPALGAAAAGARVTAMPSFETPGPVTLRVSAPAGSVTVETWTERSVEVDVTPLRGDDGSRQAAAETRVEAIRPRRTPRDRRAGAEAGGAAQLPRAQPRAPDCDSLPRGRRPRAHDAQLGRQGHRTARRGRRQVGLGRRRARRHPCARGHDGERRHLGRCGRRRAHGEDCVGRPRAPLRWRAWNRQHRLGRRAGRGERRLDRRQHRLRGRRARSDRRRRPGERGVRRRQRRGAPGPRPVDRRAVGERLDALRSRCGRPSAHRARRTGRAPHPHRERRRPYRAQSQRR